MAKATKTPRKRAAKRAVKAKVESAPVERKPAAKPKKMLDEIFVHMTPVDVNGDIQGVIVSSVPNMGRNFRLTIQKDAIPSELHDQMNCNDAAKALEILEAGLNANSFEFEELQVHAEGMYKIVHDVA